MTKRELIENAEALIVDAEEMIDRVAAADPSRSYLAQAVLADAICAYALLKSDGSRVLAAALYTRSILMSEALNAPLQ